VTVTLGLSLAGLSLVDSTSFGTLLIPIWLLLAPGRLRSGRIIVYLVTVAVFYFCVGLVLIAGADVALEGVRRAVAGIPPTPLRIGQFVVGILIISWSYWLESRARRRDGTPGKVQRWRTRAMSGTGSASALIGLALLAAALEVATMLPYLAAVGLIANAELGWQLTAGSLAGYCVVMIVPAVALAVVRFSAHDLADRLLRRLNDWFTRNSAKALGWTVGGIGIGVTLNALAVLIFEQP
jgi:Sap, sulfolipid-1-addressing protein